MPQLHLYKASAGSGKTFTLVKEYLKLVLISPQAYRKILAVTFTNKAANEMKQRVLLALTALADQNPAIAAHNIKLVKLLKEETGLSTTEIRTNAAHVLTSILHHYSDFGISTIDAFVLRLVRTFSRDLRLPFRFDVELSADTIIQSAIDRIIARIGLDEMITRALIAFAHDRIDRSENWKIEPDLRKFATKLLSEEAYKHLKLNRGATNEDWINFSKRIHSYVRAFESKISEKAVNSLQLIQSQGLDEDAFVGKTTGIVSVLKKLADGKLDGIPDSKTWLNWLANRNWAHKAAPKGDQSAVAEIETQLTENNLQIDQLFETQYAKYITARLLIRNIHAFALTRVFDDQFENIMEEENLIHISEFNKRISDIIMGSSVPYLYERTGERYQHYLLDEFQDTSVLQWHNFLPLVSNALAGGYFTMLVGDGKQAIYRFRGGEVEQFNQLPKVYQKPESIEFDLIENQLFSNHMPVVLKQNWRSSAEIVHFNNAFFAFVKKILGTFASVYDEHAQEVVNTSDPGYIEFRFSEVSSKDTNREEHLDWLTEIVQQQLEDHYSLSDIAILTRTNNEGNRVAQHLNSTGIPVVSSDSLLLRSSAKVRLMMALMQWCNDSQNPILITRIVYGIWQLKGIDSDFEPSVLQSFLHAPRPSAAMESLLNLTQGALCPESLLAKNVYDLAEYFIRILGFNQQADAYVSFFLEVIQTFENGSNQGLIDFITYWDEKGSNFSLKVPEELDAVRIMTIHKAKGLEFQIVIFPFATTDVLRNTKSEAWIDLNEYFPGPIQSGIIPLTANVEPTPYAHLYSLEHEKSILDNVNILYVALTRAISRMYILSRKPEFNKKSTFNIPDLITSFLTENMGFDATETYFSIGDAKESCRQEREKVEVMKESVKSMISVDWHRRLAVADDRLAPPLKGQKGQSAAYGKLIHALLAEIVSVDDLGMVLQRYTDEGFLTQSEAIEVKGMVHELFSNELLSDCYSAEAVVRNEKEIMTLSGDIYRPDRFVRVKERGILIDYKTGQASEAHLKQLQQYAKLIGKLEKLQPEAYLVYLQSPLHIVQC